MTRFTLNHLLVFVTVVAIAMGIYHQWPRLPASCRCRDCGCATIHKYGGGGPRRTATCECRQQCFCNTQPPTVQRWGPPRGQIQNALPPGVNPHAGTWFNDVGDSYIYELADAWYHVKWEAGKLICEKHDGPRT